MNLEFCSCVKSVRRLQPSHLTLFPQGKPRAQASLATVELVMKVTQNCWKSFASARISRANKPFASFVGHADRAPIGKHFEAQKNQGQLDILSERDENLGSAVRLGLKRIRLWRVPPNWSWGDWFEELAAVATAAAWQAICDFDPERGVPLAGFGYCRMMSCCLARYRKEWRYALYLDASNCCEEEITSSNRPDLAASSRAKVNGS